jgi:hypothetical protein
MKNSFFNSIRSIILFGNLIMVYILSSCSQKETVAYLTNINGNEVIICPVDKVTDTIQLSLSTLIESCEIIKLETSPEALFDRAWHTEISDKYICIKSYGQIPAKLFDKNGKYLRDIGTLGRGPGEYSTLNGLQFNQKGDMIFLLPFATTNKVLVYDVQGNHLKDIPLAFTQRKFKAFFSPDSIITILSMPFQNDSAICFQQDFSGRVIQKVSPPLYLINQSFDGEVFTNYLKPEYDLFNTATDTLYHYNIEKNTLEPKFAKDFGDKKYISVSREIPGYYYFYFYNRESPSRKILVNKKTLDANYFNLKNDFFGNIDASPIFSNGFFINIIPAITLKKQIEKALTNKDLSDTEKQKLVDFDKNLSMDDNDIIFYGKLKKN